jgi:hypothetical protein
VFCAARLGTHLRVGEGFACSTVMGLAVGRVWKRRESRERASPLDLGNSSLLRVECVWHGWCGTNFVKLLVDTGAWLPGGSGLAV